MPTPTIVIMSSNVLRPPVFWPIYDVMFMLSGAEARGVAQDPGRKPLMSHDAYSKAKGKWASRKAIR